MSRQGYLHRGNETPPIFRQNPPTLSARRGLNRRVDRHDQAMDAWMDDVTETDHHHHHLILVTVWMPVRIDMFQITTVVGPDLDLEAIIAIPLLLDEMTGPPDEAGAEVLKCGIGDDKGIIRTHTVDEIVTDEEPVDSRVFASYFIYNSSTRSYRANLDISGICMR